MTSMGGNIKDMASNLARNISLAGSPSASSSSPKMTITWVQSIDKKITNTAFVCQLDHYKNKNGHITVAKQLFTKFVVKYHFR